MQRIKEILNNINSNPVIVALINIIIDFIVLLLGNSITRIVASIILAGVVMVLLQRFFAYTKIKTKVLEDICEAINNYNMNYQKCYQQIGDGTISSVDTLDSASIKLTDCIETIANSILGCPVCICIKLVDPDNLIDNDYKNWHLRTIARSGSTRSERKQNDAVPDLVRENTDFCSILERNANNKVVVDGFISYDLDETKEVMKANGSEYRNSHKNFKYKATVVYPIQFKTSSLPKDVLQSLYNNEPLNPVFIAGFLCLDTEKSFSNEKELFDKAAVLLRFYCDSLAPIIKIYSLSRMKKVKRSCVLNDNKKK